MRVFVFVIACLTGWVWGVGDVQAQQTSPRGDTATQIDTVSQSRTAPRSSTTAPSDSVWSLQRAISTAQSQSPSAAAARLDYQAESSRFDATQAAYLPAVSLTGSAPGLERSIIDIVQDDGTVRYVEQSRFFSRANLNVQQILPWTNTVVSVSSGLSRIDQIGDRTNVQQWQSAPVSVGLEQPLFQYNQAKWNRRIAPLDLQIASRTLDEDLVEIAVTTTERYFDLYIAQIDEEIETFNVAVNDTIFTLSQGRFGIGSIAENELLQTELELLNAKNARSEARITLEEARQNLRRALGIETRTPIRATVPEALPEISVSPRGAVEQARRRADFLELERDMTLAQSEVASAKGTRGFSATLVARYGLNQTAPSLNEAYLDPLDQQQFGISFRMPLYRWGRGQARVDAAEAERKRTKIETEVRRDELEDEVYFQVLRARQLRQQVQTAERAADVAQRRFDVARNRYTVGKITITDLFNAQREKDQARRSYARTLRNFWVEYYRLRRLTLRR
jgi:outer membrane protein TolC